MVQPKRKYHTRHEVRRLSFQNLGAIAGYQVLSRDACARQLHAVLDDKSPCVRFTAPSVIMPYTHNMVSTVHVLMHGGKLDLDFIARCMRYSNYDRKRFAAITVRIANPKITALLFSSGKLVVTGAVSKQMAMNATRLIMDNIKRLHARSQITYKQHLIQNIVCNVRVPNITSIDIARIYKERNNLCTYQPKIFPGLIFRPSLSPIVLLVFESSRIIVTGGRTYNDILSGFNEVFVVLQQYFRSGSAAAHAPGSVVSHVADVDHVEEAKKRDPEHLEEASGKVHAALFDQVAAHEQDGEQKKTANAQNAQ